MGTSIDPLRSPNPIKSKETKKRGGAKIAILTLRIHLFLEVNVLRVPYIPEVRVDTQISV